MSVGWPDPAFRVSPTADQRERGHVALISRKSLAAHRYDLWLDELGQTCVLYVGGSARDEAFFNSVRDDRYAACRTVPDLDEQALVDALLRDHAEHPFTAIVALHEDDIVLSGELRERLDLPGQRAESAHAYRDKLVMKRHVTRSAVACPRFAAVNSPRDLVTFADDVGGPVVVKPRWGSGATGVVRLDPAACSSYAPADGWEQLIAEEWIDGPMISVDGLMVAGRPVALMVGRYTETCLTSLGSLVPHGILQADRADPLFAAALAVTADVIAALPPAPELRPFHAEFFDTPSGLVFCEIAARTGGGNLFLLMRNALGIDPEYAACLGQAGVRLALPDELVMPRDIGVFGDVVIPRGRSALARPSSDHALAGVLGSTFRDEALAYGAATAVSDIAFDALLGAEDHARLRLLYDQVVDWVARAQVPSDHATTTDRSHDQCKPA